MTTLMILIIEAASGTGRGFLARLRKKGRLYWAIAAAVLFGCVYLQHYAYEALHLTGARAWLFGQLFKLDPRPLLPRYGKVVLIGDDEYWKGALAGRRPIKRDYLATLVEKLDGAHARVIALDFDMRLPYPEATDIAEDYKKETKTLIDAVLAAAAGGRKIVLGRSVRLDANRRYILDPDIYSLSGICDRPFADGHWENKGTKEVHVAAPENIRCGFIELPYDSLVIPERLRLADGSSIDSFARAIARVAKPELVDNDRDEERYGSGIPNDVLTESHAWKWAQDVVAPKSADENAETFGGQIVIIGAGWSALGYDRGNYVDLHPTVVGANVGAVVHDNFVEALLDSRAFYAVPPWMVTGAELVFGAVAALCFAGFSHFWQQFSGLVGLSLLLLLFQWLALHELGLFFDGFFPLFGLWLHALSERTIGYHPADRRSEEPGAAG